MKNLNNKYNKKIYGYKVFNSDFTCRGYQYEVGKTYTYKGDIDLCVAGFHFCTNLKNCFNYYMFNPDNKVAQVVALGQTICGNDISVTNKIKITKELSWHEVLELVNTGKANIGLCNSGGWNSGNWNSGNKNSGDCNSGDWNSGNWNSGNKNSGDCNSGYKNSGNYNSGNWNSGDWNSGLFNSCSHANGLFNSESPKISMFNKPTEMTFKEFQNKYPKVYNLLYFSRFNLLVWVSNHDMTAEEKETHPEYKTTGGYLKRKNYKKACQEMWEGFNKEERDEIKKLPNFDRNVFFEITGIEI